MVGRTQIQRGIGLAFLAALLFGATVPILKPAIAGAGAFASGSLLYLGAAICSGLLLMFRRRRTDSGLLRGPVLIRLLVVALLGAVCAPALLISGVKRTDAATTSLLLTLETPFTLMLARLFFREYFGRRAIVAAALILCGGLWLTAGPPATGNSAVGIALVAAAMMAWALDNAVSRTLADLDPVAVVALKGLIGAVVSGAVAVAMRESLPPPQAAAVVFAMGAIGYGVSLQLYLRAQTLVGAGRTASVFAAAPFVGTAVALLLGAPWPGWTFLAAGALVVAGVVLHVSEHHRHRHTHESAVHEHMHTHADGHHTHVHDPLPTGAHSHVHQHDGVTHEHEHGEDIHHRHRH
jgi:drug/metabolite transporter (DMT)-like permease